MTRALQLFVLATFAIGCAEVTVVPDDSGAMDAGVGSVDAGGADAGYDAGVVPLETSDPGFTWEPPAETGADPGDEAVTLLVIFDKSGSMSAPWVVDEDESFTRWTAASGALLNAIWPVRARVTVGAILFPVAHSCGAPALADDSQLDFRPAEMFVDAWLTRAPMNGPAGSTPMQAAFESAAVAIDRAEASGLLENRLEVVLLTDGEPNCGTELAAVVELVEGWHTRGIRTTVMGLPGSEPAVVILDAVAVAGGAEAHQPVGEPGDLEDAVGALL